MKETFRLEINRYFKFSNGQIALISDSDPKLYPLITADFIATIKVDGLQERLLNILRQDILVKSRETKGPVPTVIRTTDNLEDLLVFVGAKKVIVSGYKPNHFNT